MPRKPRNANRGTLQHIEDAFADLETGQQEKMLESLASLHRWSKRERARKPAKDEPGENPASHPAKDDAPASLELHLAPEIPPSEREA